MKYSLIERIADLVAENQRLRLRNAELERKNAEYLRKWVAAQELASNRQVMAFLGKVLTADGQLLNPVVTESQP